MFVSESVGSDNVIEEEVIEEVGVLGVVPSATAVMVAAQVLLHKSEHVLLFTALQRSLIYSKKKKKKKKKN